MVCCGVTEPCDDHADRVLRLANELVEVAQLVHVNDNPLTIRVGARLPLPPGSARRGERKTTRARVLTVYRLSAWTPRRPQGSTLGTSSPGSSGSACPGST